MPTVSLIMIVRDEAANLPACLQSCADLFTELVIVDTGSLDNTKEIARSFGANVFDFQWCDDFAAARNESLRHASGEWVFWMDADNRIDAVNRGRLRALLGQLEPATAYVMQVLSHDSLGAIPPAEELRLFPAGTLRWQGCVHEEMLLDEHVQPVRTGVAIEHVGYADQELLRRKTERNLRLLYRKLAELPDDARTLFQLAGELLNTDRAEDAWRLFCRAVELAERPTVQWYPSAIYGRALAAHRLGLRDGALGWLRAQRTPETERLLERLRAHGVPIGG